MSDNAQTIASVFPGAGELTHDAAGLTPEEREAQPYPYNCYVPGWWPGPGAPPTFPPADGKEEVLKTDQSPRETDSYGPGAALTFPATHAKEEVLKTDQSPRETDSYSLGAALTFQPIHGKEEVLQTDE